MFDYALGEISDELHHALRAGGPDRLTAAGKLGLPQVICPRRRGAHRPVPQRAERAAGEVQEPHQHVPQPDHRGAAAEREELVEVAKEIGKRLQHTKGNAVFMIPLRGTSRYGVEGGPLRNPEGDKAFFAAIKRHLPKTIEVVEKDLGAEDPEFVREVLRSLDQVDRERRRRSNAPHV